MCLSKVRFKFDKPAVEKERVVYCVKQKDKNEYYPLYYEKKYKMVLNKWYEASEIRKTTYICPSRCGNRCRYPNPCQSPDWCSGQYKSGFHTFKRLEDAQKYQKGEREVILKAKIKDVTCIGKQDNATVYVSDYLQLIEEIG